MLFSIIERIVFEAEKAGRVVQISSLTKRMGQFLIDNRNEKQTVLFGGGASVNADSL